MTPDWLAVRDVATAHDQFRRWMFELALPFWERHGHDEAVGGAREHLNLDATPADPGFTRMRVQARQLYCFSHAALLGWQPGERLARAGYGFITQAGERPDGGWVRRLTADGRGVIDGAVDLYDQAFVLFALGWYARLTRDEAPLARARRTLDWITTHMAAPPIGFRNVVPPEPGPRQQNPHMHLLEAALALFDTGGEPVWRDLADQLVDLFRQHLFDRETGTLGEFFDDQWRPAAGAAGSHREPGHQLEWVWLLGEYDRLTGNDTRREAAALYRFAVSRGIDRPSGLAVDIVGRDGAPRARSRRLWPQTEAIKAHVSLADRGDRGAAARIAPAVRALGTRFLAACPPGAWIDHFAADGTPIADRIPTSSFYHLFMSYAGVAGPRVRQGHVTRV